MKSASAPRPDLGTIGVAPGDRSVHVWFHDDGRGATACAGAKEGIKAGLTGEAAKVAGEFAGAGEGGAFVAAPFLAVMLLQSAGSAIGGALDGVAKGVPKKLAEKSALSFRQAVPYQDVRARLQGLALDAVRQRKPGQVVRLAQPPWLVPRPQGVTTVLQAEYLSVGLHNRPVSAQQEFRATGYARLVAVAGGRTLESCVVEYRSGQDRTHTLAEWAANDAQLLREELERCQERMAEQLVGRLLGEALPAGLATVPPAPNPNVHDGSFTGPIRRMEQP